MYKLRRIKINIVKHSKTNKVKNKKLKTFHFKPLTFICLL